LSRAYRREQDAVMRAEEALNHRDELLAIIAHDLRSPLSAVLLKASLIQALARKDQANAKIADQATAIEAIATRMAGLIQSLLDASMLEAGRLSIAPEQCPPQSLVDAALEVCAPQAEQRSIQLVTELEPVEAATVWADKDRAVQVLSNLLGNAIKFTPEGGTIRVGVIKAGGEVRFSVSDTGPGIDAKHRPHLFERYWRAERGGRRGAGLGLFIAKGIVEAHGGKIGLDTVPGGGATFAFSLPVRPAGSPPSSPVTTSAHVAPGVSSHG
jgi:signal transduction histidine kinase